MYDAKFFDLIENGDLDSKLVLIKPKILYDDVFGPDDWKVHCLVEKAYRSELIDYNLEPVLNEPTGNEEEDYNRKGLEHIDNIIDALSSAAQARWFRLAIDGKIALPKNYKNYKMLWQDDPYVFDDENCINILPEVKSAIDLANQPTEFQNDAILYLEEDFLRNADNIEVTKDALTDDHCLHIDFDIDYSINTEDPFDKEHPYSYASFYVGKKSIHVMLGTEEVDPREKEYVTLALTHYEERTLNSLDELIVLCDSIKDRSIEIKECNHR